MNFLYWDIENVKKLTSAHKFFGTRLDVVQCCYAKPFDDVKARINLDFDSLKLHHLNSRGPDLADFHILSVLNMDVLEHGRDNNFYLATEDKLLSYRFIVLARNLSIHRHNIHTQLSEQDIRFRSKKGRSLFEDGDLDKVPPSIL